MGCVFCQRCTRLVNLDYNVDDVVVLSDGIHYACVECLTDEENEYLERTGEFDLQKYTEPKLRRSVDKADLIGFPLCLGLIVVVTAWIVCYVIPDVFTK